MARLVRWVWVPVAVLAVLPLMVAAVPPVHDYPFHLARADAVAALFGQVRHGTVYVPGSLLLPNLAMDAVMLGLTAVLAPAVAGRVFLGLVLLLMLGGTAALHRALHGRWSAWPLVVGFFLYNAIFVFGFTNYLFGVGVMLWAVAAWVALAGSRWRVAAGCLFAVVLLFCHLVAFGLFAVVLGGLALGDVLRGGRGAWGRLLAASAPVLVGVVVFVVLSPTAGEVRQPLAYRGAWAWKPMVAWRTLLGVSPWLDLVTLGPVVVAGAWLAATGRVVVARGMVAGLVLLGFAFAVMPYELFGSLYGDARLPVALLAVGIASLDVRGLRGRVAGALVVAGLGLFAGRMGAVAGDWAGMQARFAAHGAAFDALPAGSVLWAATAAPYPSLLWRGADELALWRPPLKHVASLASVGRDVFVPSTWADPFKQPIAVPERLRAAKALQGDNPWRTPDGAALGEAVAAVRRLGPGGHLLLSYPERLQGGLPAGLVPVASGADFLLLRVLP